MATIKQRKYTLWLVTLLVTLMAFAWGAGAQEGNVVDDVVENGASHGFLGIIFDTAEEGVLVIYVLPESPADSVGLLEGDVITEVNDEIVSGENIAELIGAYTAGQQITLTVLRDGEILTVEPTLIATPEGLVASFDGIGPGSSFVRPFLGVSLVDGENGVRVTQVVTGSPADSIGLQVGDLIREVNGQVIDTAAAVASAITRQMPTAQIRLVVERDGETLELDVVLRALSTRGYGLRLAPDLTNPNLVTPDARGMFRTITSDITVTYLEDESAWVIEELSETSAFYADGLRVGDKITLVDGEPFTPHLNTPLRLEMRRGQNVTLTVERNDETLEVETSREILASMLFGVSLRLGGFDNLDQLFEMEILPPSIRVQPRIGRGITPHMPGMPRMTVPGGARLGVAFLMLDAQVANEYNVEVTDGALVTQVVPRSPADNAGLQVKDIIVSVDGQALTTLQTLRDVIARYVPGDVVTLEIVRDGENLTITATLGQPEQFGSTPSSGMTN